MMCPLRSRPLSTPSTRPSGASDTGYERHKRFSGCCRARNCGRRSPFSTRASPCWHQGWRKRIFRRMRPACRPRRSSFFDLERFEQQAVQFACVDLVAIGRGVVVDLAPLAFAAGYRMSFEPEDEAVAVSGDRISIERALTNLVQNAISSMAAEPERSRSAWPGRPSSRSRTREAAFRPRRATGFSSPLHRLHPQSRGHRPRPQPRAGYQCAGTESQVVVLDAPSGGASLRMIFPAANMAG